VLASGAFYISDSAPDEKIFGNPKNSLDIGVVNHSSNSF
jgi:hypothetical protein